MIDFTPAPASLPQGQRVYAIGDVHGCLDRLEALHALIAEDLAARPADGAALVHLGDYVDRGPDSAGVVARLAAGAVLAGVRTVNLMGNHEHMMLAAIATGETEATELWLANGGADSLLSWGVPRSAQPKEWPSYLPKPHLVFLRDLAVRHAVGGYLFVHAGIRPRVALDQQDENDLMWIREEFLDFTGDFGKYVVHGHTPVPKVDIRRNRMNIDTGAYATNRLTTVRFRESNVAYATATTRAVNAR